MPTMFGLAEQNKKLAAEQCIRLLGQKNPEAVHLNEDGLFEHTNSRGKIRHMKVCSTFKEYLFEQADRPAAKLHKCVGYYVLYWTK